MDRIIHVPMCSELCFDVCVTKDAHFCREVFAMCSEYATVEIDWRKEGHLTRSNPFW